MPRISDAAVFNKTNALSFHNIPTYNQPTQPIKDSVKSYVGRICAPLNIIALSKVKDDAHFIYQDKSCLGVADLYHRLEPCNSFLVGISLFIW